MVGRQFDHGSRGIWNKPVDPKRKPRVNQPIEIDCHETQKAARDKARAELEKARVRKENRRAAKAAARQSTAKVGPRK